MSKSLTDRILKAGVFVAAAHVILKFMGLLLTKVATHYLAPDVYECVMVVAFTGVIQSLFYIGQELLTPTFLSVFMKEKEEKGEPSAWQFANVTLSTQLLLLLATAAVIASFPDFFIRCFTTWTPEKNPDHYWLLRKSLQIMSPGLVFLSLGSTTYVLLNGYKRFFVAAFGDSATKIVVLLGICVGIGLMGMKPGAVSVIILAGCVAKLVTHLCGLGRKCGFLRFSLNWRNPAFLSLLLLMLPLLFGVLFAKVRDNFNNIYILTRIETRGVLMANDLGRKLFATIQWLVPYSLQIALFPFLCELAGRNEKEKLGEVLSNSCRMLLSFFLPFAILLFVIAQPLSILIFHSGKTSLEIARWAGLSTACYCLVLPATALESVLQQGLFANRKTALSTVIGVGSSFISIAVSYYFIVVRQADAEKAIMAVALGFVASKLVKSILLAVVIGRQVPLNLAGNLGGFFAKLVGVTAATGLAAWGAARLIARIEHVSGKSALLVQMGSACLAGAVVYAAGVWLFHFQEPKTMLAWIRSRVSRKGGESK